MILKPRYVFDNNAIVSALVFEHSVSGQAFYAALDHREILVSQETFAELKFLQETNLTVT
jgi:predicted nucleic acid-binding protein